MVSVEDMRKMHPKRKHFTIEHHRCGWFGLVLGPFVPERIDSKPTNHNHQGSRMAQINVDVVYKQSPTSCQGT